MKRKNVGKKLQRKRKNNFFFFHLTTVYRLIILVVIYTLAIIGLFVAYWGHFGYPVIQLQTNIAGPVTQYPTIETSEQPMQQFALPTPCPTVPLTTSVDFPADGKIHLLPMLNISGHDQNCSNGGSSANSYYSAGFVGSGKYIGYKRIITYTNVVGGSAGLVITNDFKNYLSIFSYPEKFIAGRAYVDAVDVLEQTFPSDIPLPNNFALHRSGIFSLPTLYTKYYPPNDPIVTNFSQFNSLNSFSPGLQFYAQPVNTKIYTNAAITQYFNDLTSVIAVDHSGLAYTYSLTTPASINIWNQTMDQLSQKKILYDSNINDTYPTLQINSKDISLSQPMSLYDTYDEAIFDQGCGGRHGYSTLIAKSITDSDLHKIGSWQGIDLYAFSDSNHYLYKMLYESVAGTGDKRSPAIPDYADYTGKTPLLFMKDPWGRWVVVAENKYDPVYNKGNLIGGCGKPVMYFYPQKPTEIKVQFKSPMQFDVQIPRYRNGWDIFAQPNGILKDLFQKSGDCDYINPKQKGSEYALGACKNNQYPYIYWAGQTLNTYYPLPREGAIVSYKDLQTFMNKSLDTIGFKPNEKQDMLSYWLPEMLSKQASYYRIYFLQTDEVNSLFPISISPKPDSMYRLFMDWETLTAKPVIGIPPQHLEKINRNGFFMLEWGGLER